MTQLTLVTWPATARQGAFSMKRYIFEERGLTIDRIAFAPVGIRAAQDLSTWNTMTLEPTVFFFLRSLTEHSLWAPLVMQRLFLAYIFFHRLQPVAGWHGLTPHRQWSCVRNLVLGSASVRDYYAKCSLTTTKGQAEFKQEVALKRSVVRFT